MRLNIDVGELPQEPEALYEAAHLVSVACGGHAGDAVSMRRACALAAAHGASVGAHPSYPDRAGFGRVAVELSPAELRRSLDVQLADLVAAAGEVGVALTHVKAHGALYHRAAVDPVVAEIVLDASRALGAPSIIAPPGAVLAGLARAAGLSVLVEGFADRGLRPDGTLVPRGEPGASLDDVGAVRAQAARLVAEGRFDTVCVHGDGPHAVAFARAVREVLSG